MKKTFIKKYTQTRLDNLLGIDNSNKYQIPLYNNFENFKNDYPRNLNDYLKHNPNESEESFVAEILYNKYQINNYKTAPIDFKFTLSERKYDTFIEVQFTPTILENILRNAIKKYILKCYHKKMFLSSTQLINWDEIVVDKGKIKEIDYTKITDEALKIFLKYMGDINNELLLTKLPRIYLHNYTYINKNKIKFDYYGFMQNEYIEYHKIAKYLFKRFDDLQNTNHKVNTHKIKYKNPQKLALLQELGFFELPIFNTLTETRINEITGILLDADPKEFVYKNRLNLKSKSPDYQTHKYTAYQYTEEMKRLISETD
ncbi:hypothetical protein [Chryseobacterium phocaeense]|uniref:hypothetical protein n=1 Tax=Chryseobacterium phocaeense TaxID=1816690 RepID=UPI0009B9F31C|nr:hypothetical protein [Chryseobacterium phocaeense]